MSPRKKPLKPERNPGHIVFPKQGPIRRVVEQFPRTQDDLELMVGTKFLGALAHFEGISYHNLQKGPEPADLTCTSLDGRTIELQIVEVVDHRLLELQRMRSSYRDALISRLGDEILKFNGCRVSLMDAGDPPYLPPPDSTIGKACLEILLNHVQNVAKDIHTLDVGKIRSRRVSTADPIREISAFIERMPPGNPPRLEFLWEGGGPCYRSDIPRGLLIDAVQSKLAKRYVKPSNSNFILLAYSIDALITSDDRDVPEVHRILSVEPNPFDEIWFIRPYAERNLGAIFRIWPIQESTRRMR